MNQDQWTAVDQYITEILIPPDPALEWIPYHVKRSWRENLGLIRAQMGSRNVRISAIILEPRTPHWPMRRAAWGPRSLPAA